MEEESEYKKLPTEDKCVHKLWKARVAGYEEAAKLFKQIDDDKSPEWNKYLGLIKKFVSDSNAVAQEKGLEAALAFVENCALAGKTVGEVMSGIVTKCIAAPKTKTKELALQVTLMYIEIEKHEAVQEELMKGMEHKNPKISCACIVAVNTALRQFGNKVIGIKLLVKKISTMLTDRDKDVRTEGKALVVEMHRWVGAALESHIGSLQPVVLQELRDAFSDTPQKTTPERYLRSQQAVRPTAAANQNDDGGEEEEEDEDASAAPDCDPYELVDPVDILSKLPKDFYDKLEEKKWQERKEALDALEALLKAAPKLEQGDYGDLMRALKKVISKDSNVMLVALAGKCVSLLALGLKKRFQTYSSALLSCALDKFKEKKPNVVAALREAVDAIYPCTTIEAICEDVVEALGNKNPAVKAETASFLSRALARTQPASVTKKLLKAYVGALLKVLESADPIVRDQAAEALGMATKLVGEKNISPFIGKLDNLKEQKIQECCEKAVILVKVAGPKKEVRPKTAPAKSDGKAGSAQPKPVKRPTTGVTKKPGTKKPAAGGGKAAAPREMPEREMSPDEVEMKAEEILDPAIINGLSDPNWKMRVEAVQSFTTALGVIELEEGTAQVLLKTLNKKPGLKDTNFQALKMRLEAIKSVTEKFPISTTCVECIVSDVAEKLADSKCASAATEALEGLADACRLEPVLLSALDYAIDKQRSPRVQAEVLLWAASTIRARGPISNTKGLLSYVKKGLATTNPAVRTAAVTLTGALYTHLGTSIQAFIDAEKPAVRTQIQQELDRCADEEPAPRLSKSASKGSMDDLEDQGSDAEILDEPAPVNDSRARTDLAPLLTEALMQEMGDKNWKVRCEALEKVKTLITDAGNIKPGIAELPASLAPRLVDSNSKISQLALQVCEALATAIGPKAKQHGRLLFPGIFQGLGDSKTWVRSAALQCINVWSVQCGVTTLMDGEMVFDALKTGSPILRAELWGWLAEKLPTVPVKSIPREELALCIPLLYTAVEDRGAEVRRAAGEAVLGFMIHMGPDSMLRLAEKLKPGSKSVVQAALDKARPNLPVQPLPKSEAKVVKSGGAAKPGTVAKPGIAKPTKGIVKSASAGSARGKKEEEDSFAPLLAINNIKHQRIIDDQKLKVLKWNFVTPREEFFELLKDQMITANVNKSLVANMFHADFRYHIKAIESLIEDLPDNGQALICNLDLVLKWLTLRFFDTNPSVLLRGLEYLSAAFTFLTQENYHMAEYEANCFIPYLVLKVGDPKDTVRNGVKSLLKQICVLFSASKLFGYIMEGLKSKNARQRTECLDVLGLLIESFGTSVCVPSTTAALKEVARQISDRDNSVRTAALNCVVQAYFLEGEKIYKMIGQISDKDHSLLEERIKRAAKGRDTNRKSMLLPLSATGRLIQPETKSVNQVPAEQNVPNNDYDDEEEEPIDYPPPPMSTQVTQPKDSTPKHTYTLSKMESLPMFMVKVNNIRERTQVRLKKPPALLPLPEINYEPTSDPFVTPMRRSMSGSSLMLTVTKVAPANARQLDPLHLEGAERLVHQVSRERPRPISGPFGLDPTVVAAIEDGLQDELRLITQQPALQEMDTSFLDEPVPVPLPAVHPRPNLASNMALSPPSRLSMAMPMRMNPPTPLLNHPSLQRPDADNELSRIILEIASPRLSVCLGALSKMDAILRSSQANHLAAYEEQFLMAVTEQLQQLQATGHTNDPNAVFNAYRCLMTVLISFYESRVAGMNVSIQTIGGLVDQLLRVLISRALERTGDREDSLVRVANLVCVKVLERSDHTSLIIALVNLLDKSVAGDPPSQRYQELEMKCLWKVMKTMPTWDSDTLDYDKLMYRLHMSFKAYPASYWKKNPSLSDTPFRTIKTMVHTLVKKKGSSIMNHLTLIPDINESELYAYLQKLFKTLKLDEHKKENIVQQVAPPPDSVAGIGKPMPRLVQEELSQILKRIGEKEHSKEALGQLYDLRERHPAVDIWACLKDASSFFRSYIERGLREVAEERRSGRGEAVPPPLALSLPLSGIVPPSNIQSGDIDGQSSKGHMYYSERLRALRAKVGLGSESASNSQPRTPVIDNRTLADAIEENAKQNIDPKFDLPSLHPPSSRSEPQIDALRQKLQQIKSANR